MEYGVSAHQHKFTLTSMCSSDGKFLEIFTGGNFPLDVHTSFFPCLFFYHIIYVFTVLSMFPETFRKSSITDM
jgi:hypothetical protein